MPLNKLIEPVGCVVDVTNGGMSGATGQYSKKFADLRELYADKAAFDAMRSEWSERIVYDVSDFCTNSSPGDLAFGVTRMSPGKVGEEFFLTRGHVHKQARRPEIYYGQKGSGLMLMESPEGDVRIVAIEPLTVCYVPPYWIHRSVNVGSGDLVMLFCYPSDSGQVYDIIVSSGGMRARIVDDGSGGWKRVENTQWRPRDAETIAALYRPQPIEIGA
jgi:glucose-6-phosphate isomerase